MSRIRKKRPAGRTLLPGGPLRAGYRRRWVQSPHYKGLPAAPPNGLFNRRDSVAAPLWRRAHISARVGRALPSFTLGAAAQRLQ
ncbi:hypothetical protein BOC40_18705 [Burkholderia pseudomallei]|nr:hypothetical protein BOC35_28090 [Burkholderia pseudomallei]ARK53134.1 hypothetical protein BOC36_08310 [Burkholderia pseudomallei]ARK64155.1 hypothetical protein BOC37_31690 [Burkholderia pseudomallei]ARK67579.1 hypothetical protein BOC38_13135 [Burkholderia pseudomallei]ARK76885.1 hypothetical protein BOC39_25880 [Burkholderia pseudomallei]